MRKEKLMKKEKEIAHSNENESKDNNDEVIAFRKACDAKGTGLSHYILLDKKEK